MMSLAAYGVRSYAYAAATEPWQILIIQLLHGLTFSTMLVAGVSFANEIAPKGMGATAQGLFTSTVSGLGGITGALVGGFLLDRLGGGPMFFWSGTAVLAGLLVFMAFGKNLSAAAQVDKPQIP
jgi:MFS family permease